MFAIFIRIIWSILCQPQVNCEPLGYLVSNKTCSSIILVTKSMERWKTLFLGYVPIFRKYFCKELSFAGAGVLQKDICLPRPTWVPVWCKKQFTRSMSWWFTLCLLAWWCTIMEESFKSFCQVSKRTSNWLGKATNQSKLLTLCQCF